MSLFKRRSKEEFTKSLANYFPGGKLFRAKNDPSKKLYNLIQGLACEQLRVNDLLREYNDQIFPDETVDFIEEWESALGLPDECLSIEGKTIDERRTYILLKLAGMHVQTAADFEAVAAVFGISSTVKGGKDPSVSPVITPDKTARFTIVVQFVPAEVFTYTFPIVFGSSAISVLQCLFLKIRPANCDVRFDSI